MNARIKAIFDYCSIVLNRRENPLPKEEYGESHHIWPRSFGGSNEKSNLVRLTPEEHYRCHRLLVDICKGTPLSNKATYAWWAMAWGRKDKLKISEEEYGKLRREFAKLDSKIHKGKKLSEETKQKMSLAHKGFRLTKEHIEKLRQAAKRSHFWQDKINKNPEKIKKTAEKHKGMKRSEEARKRMSEARKRFFANGGKVWNKGN